MVPPSVEDLDKFITNINNEGDDILGVEDGSPDDIEDNGEEYNPKDINNR